MTQWRDVPGWEGLYRVSDTGQVRGYPRQGTNGEMLRTWARDTGHLTVRLYDKGRVTTYGVHQLVMRAFVGPCPDGLEVCHSNGDATDNQVANLRYGTRAENVADMRRHGTHGMTVRGTCPRGHLLQNPNLVQSKAALGYRECLACARARAARQKRPELDLAAVAANRYERIMADA